MSAIGRARAWVRAVVSRGRVEEEMRAEIAAHFDQAIERFTARGMTDREARLAARREFGHLGTVQQDGREARGGLRAESIVADITYALRFFGRTPLATGTVLTLALGIGFSSAVFSTLHGIFMRPAPGVPVDPALVKINGVANEPPFARKLSYPELSAYTKLTGTFESVAGWVSSGVVVDAGERDLGSATASAQFVTPNYFSTLGIGLAAGRDFDQSRPDALFVPELTAIVSHAFAVELFGNASSAVGKELTVNEATVTIIGVAPPRFNGAVQSGQPRRIWLPLASWQQVDGVKAQLLTDPRPQIFEAFGRLRPGVTVEEARPPVSGVAAQIDAESNALAKRSWIATADVVRLRGLVDAMRYASERGPVSVIFSGIAVLILLVCTTTVNSMLVGAAVARRHEIGVRLALGASRVRIVRQLLTEIMIVAIAGGAIGMWVFGALAQVSEVAQDGFDLSPNWATAGFTLLYAVLAATLAGLAPALHATRTGLAEVLKDNSAGATGKSRLQRSFVIAQIAIAQPLMVMLAAATANVLKEIPELGNVFVRERLMIAEFDTRMTRTANTPDPVPALMQRLTDLPGVVTVLPVGYSSEQVALESSPPLVDERGTPIPVSGDLFEVPPGYFAAIGVPITRGREFVASDTLSAVQPVVINRILASQLFKSGNPIGQRVRRILSGNQPPIELEVVGVVEMEQQNNTLDYPGDFAPLFVPLRTPNEGRLLIRTTTPAEPMIATVLSVARTEARMVPMTRIKTLARADRERRASRLGVFGVGAACGMIVLALASVGLYAMLSVAVGQRRREIGVRLALGAHARQVVLMFFRGGMRVTLLGMAIGLPLSLAGLAITDVSWQLLPISAALVTFTVLTVGALASWLPARRAASVSPMVALRTE